MDRITCTDGSIKLSYSTKETAEAIRTALKAAFPGIKFSVRTSYASMTSSTHVKWTDGPTEAEVETVTNRYTSRGFDGMTDSNTYHSQEVNGQRVQYSGWVETRRDLSVALMSKAVARFNYMRAEYGLAPVNVTITDHGFGANVGGPDANLEAGVSAHGFKYHFHFVSEAIAAIAYHMRDNGCLVMLKAA